MTAACSVSASSTRCFIAAGVRATRSATITGCSAATSSRAASATAPESPCGADGTASFGIAIFASLASACSCISELTTRTTGAMGGVSAILYARTADSAKCGSDIGVSSHFV